MKQFAFDKQIQNGIQSYVKTMETRVIDNVQLYLVAFVISLTPEQVEQLKKDQIEFHEASYIFFSDQFINKQIKKDII